MSITTSGARYHTLVASLPNLPPLLTTKQTPLSRIQLERRLGMLTEDDARVLARVERLLQWARRPMEHSDETIVREAEAVIAALRPPLLREVVSWRFELRTVVAALRRRERRLPPPERSERWGYGRYTDHIRRHWSEPHFKLEPVYPWLAEAARMLREGDALGLERLLLEHVWGNYTRAAETHYFDFEAVALYVLRWDLIARWVAYDGARAARRFEALAEAGLGEAVI